MAARSNDHGIHCMMPVAVGADFGQSPARTQERGELAREHDAAFRFAFVGELQITLDIVLEEFADVAGVVEVTFTEALRFFLAKVLAQQTGAFGKAVAFVAFNPGGEAPPAFTVARAAQVFVGRGVTLVAVLFCQHQHLVVFTIVVTARVGQGVVDLGVADVVENPVKIECFQRIRALAILFSVKLKFFELSALGRNAEFSSECRLDPVVALAVFILHFLDLAALVHRARQVACHFDMDRRRRAVFSNQRIHHLARLIQRAQHDGVAWNTA